MELHMQSTIFGQLLRWISRKAIYKYPDEIDPSLWKSSVHQVASQEFQQSQQSQEPEHTNGHTNKSETGIQKDGTRNGDIEKDTISMPPRDSSHDVLVVGWYGPDDPEASDSRYFKLHFVPVSDARLPYRIPRIGLAI